MLVKDTGQQRSCSVQDPGLPARLQRDHHEGFYPTTTECPEHENTLQNAAIQRQHGHR